MLGCTMIGAIIGYTFPISLPACGLFIILNPPKKLTNRIINVLGVQIKYKKYYIYFLK